MPSRLPSTFTLKEALTNYIDITTPASQEILAGLADMTDDAREKKLLTTLARDGKTFDRWRVRKATTLPQLLATFANLRLDPEFLLRKFPTLQPRLYAIASSPAEGKIRIATAIVKEKGCCVRARARKNAIFGRAFSLSLSRFTRRTLSRFRVEVLPVRGRRPEGS